MEFGGTSATKLTVNSSTSITATSPQAVPGVVDVTVTTPAGTSALSLKDHFKFTPLVNSVSPSSGPSAGGTTVTITGSGFALGTSGTIIKFGATASKSVNCTSSERCTAVSPKHEAATVDVTARVNKVPSPKTSADHFTYV